MAEGGKKSYNKGLLILLGVLCLAIVGLGVGIGVVLLRGNENSNETVHVVLTDEMEGWEGTISEATQALILSENIDDMLENDPDYTIDNAIRDYENAFNTSSDDLRFNVAIEYAYFMLDASGDVDTAIGIMERVEDLIDVSQNNAVYYYNTLYTLCEKSNDIRMYDYEEKLNNAIELQEEEE